MDPNIIVADNNDEVAQELIKIVKKTCDLKTSGKVIIGLSGGSLPKFLAAGMKSDIGKAIDWSNVTFIFCDERMVPVGDPESTLGVYLNHLAGLVKEEQFVKVATDLDVDAAAIDYEAKLKAIMGQKPEADLLLLGMGPDGHTCSLFPGHDLLNETAKVVASIKDSPKPPPQRVTLTLPVINDAKAVVFVSTGEGKKDMVKNVLKDKLQEFPSTRVKPTNGQLYWILDKPAASNL
jgi:6-phosphogluconolactonase